MDKGGTRNGKLCYRKWIAHIKLAETYNLNTKPETIIDFGYGFTLGTGIAGLLLGASKLYGLGVKAKDFGDENIQVAKEISKELDVPEQRLDEVVSALRGFGEREGIEVHHYAPWGKGAEPPEGCADLVFSNVTMEHVDDIDNAYRCMYKWLKHGGYVSHIIDYRCHGDGEWNNHWTIQDYEWKRIMDAKHRAGELYFINRIPHSGHIQSLEKAGFRIVCDESFQSTKGADRLGIAKRFQRFTDKDLYTTWGRIQAVKE